MPTHVTSLGNLELRVLPDRDWAVLTRCHNGVKNSVGFTSADLVDAAALLQTASDWMSSRHDNQQS